MLTMPKTQYAKADGGAHIAYQVVGQPAAPFDVILIPRVDPSADPPA